MAVSKYWGDEKLKDAVYSVYLKKVRYVPPTGYEGLPLYRPIDPDSHHLAPDLGADHLQWETIRERVIKAGSLDRLVQSLITSEDVLDSRHFNVFFATYRAFARPDEVLQRLLDWFDDLDIIDDIGSASAVAKQGAIKSILMCWTDMYPEDFYNNEDTDFVMLARLIDFAKAHGLSDLKHRGRRLRERFRRVAEEGGLQAQLPSLDRFTVALGFDRNDYLLSRERVKMFDVGKENCVQIAEQLTFWDAALFKELLPYQCQGAIWGRRHKNHPSTVFSVRATIDQFNAVSQRVMTSIVLPECKPDFRARIIEKWVDIARELRALKNFSSLKAVLSALQAEPVHRLKATWALVPKYYIAQFKELSSIFDVDENGEELRARSILDAEGTAKSSPLRRPQLIQNCRRTKSDVNLAESQGTVPYLGSFLTDLVMIDQAHPDYTEDGLSNFEKRRKEFEVMAKIKLFQSAARAYNVPMDQGFCGWFHYLPALNENECFVRSLEVERLPASTQGAAEGGRRQRSSGGRLNGNASTSPFAAHSSPLSKINTLSRMFTSLSSSNALDSPDTAMSRKSPMLNGQTSNDSGIHTEDSVASNSSSEQPGTVMNSAMALLSRGKNGSGGSSSNGRCFTAPSTPLSTISWRGGSEFNPYTNENGYSSSRSDTPQNMTEVIGPESARLHHPALLRGKLNSGANDSHTSTSSPSSSTRSSCNSSTCASATHNNNNGTPTSATNGNSVSFHLARVGLDDSLQTEPSGANYKVIKVENGERMATIVERALDKHMLDVSTRDEFCLVQLLPDGSELLLPETCNPYYAVAPDPTSPMLNLLLKKRIADDRPHMAPSAKKLNRMKRSNLLRWSSGYL